MNLDLDKYLLFFPSSDIFSDPHLIDIIHQSNVDFEMGISSIKEQQNLIKTSIPFLKSDQISNSEKLEITCRISSIFFRNNSLFVQNFIFFENLALKNPFVS